jgi:hypothetical protein
MLTVIMTCRLVLDLRDLSSHEFNPTPNKLGSYLPSSVVPVIKKAARGSHSSTFGEKNGALLPIAVAVHQDVTVSTSQPISPVHIPHSPRAHYSADRVVTPPWEQNNPMWYIHGNPGTNAES